MELYTPELGRAIVEAGQECLQAVGMRNPWLLNRMQLYADAFRMAGSFIDRPYIPADKKSQALMEIAATPHTMLSILTGQAKLDPPQYTHNKNDITIKGHYVLDDNKVQYVQIRQQIHPFPQRDGRKMRAYCSIDTRESEDQNISRRCLLSYFTRGHRITGWRLLLGSFDYSSRGWSESTPLAAALREVRSLLPGSNPESLSGYYMWIDPATELIEAEDARDRFIRFNQALSKVFCQLTQPSADLAASRDS